MLTDNELAGIQKRHAEGASTPQDVKQLLQHIDWLHGELRLTEGALDAVLYERDADDMTVGAYRVYEAMGGGVGVWVVDEDGKRIRDE